MPETNRIKTQPSKCKVHGFLSRSPLWVIHCLFAFLAILLYFLSVRYKLMHCRPQCRLWTRFITNSSVNGELVRGVADNRCRSGHTDESLAIRWVYCVHSIDYWQVLARKQDSLISSFTPMKHPPIKEVQVSLICPSDSCVSLRRDG